MVTKRMYRMKGRALFWIGAAFLIGTFADVAMLHLFNFAIGGFGSFLACAVAIVLAFQYTGRKMTPSSLVAMLNLHRPKVTRFSDWILIAGVIVLMTAVLFNEIHSGGLKALTVGLLAYALSAAIIPPFIEEMIDRGFIQSALQQLDYGPLIAVSISSIIFSLSHYPVNSDVVGLSLVAGMLFGAITYRTHSVWIPFVLHGLWNFTTALLNA